MDGKRRLQAIVPMLFLVLMNTLAVFGQDRREKIPFRLTEYNNIVIEAVLNGRDTVDLMLHTAAGDMTLTKTGSTGLATVKFEGEIDSVQSWGGNSNTSAVSRRNALQIGSYAWSDITIYQNENSGQHTDGKFGINLFNHKVLEFDFNKKVLIVSDQLPRKVKRYGKFALTAEYDELYVEAVCQIEKNAYPNRYLIHTGYAGAVLLDDQFVQSHHIGQQIPITGERKLSDSFGNVLTTKKGLMPAFVIGRFELINVPVGFFESASGMQNISIIGGDVLKRFNWVIDADRKFIYLKTNKLFKSNFNNN